MLSLLARAGRDHVCLKVVRLLLSSVLFISRLPQVMKDTFWKRFNSVQNGHRSYTVEGIEKTLETVGVECNTHVSDLVDALQRLDHLFQRRYQEDGKPVSTGRWILLRNGFFLLRAAHTIRWIANPAKQTSVGEQKDNAPSIVWDWKSAAENWRWNVYQLGAVGTDILVKVEECDNEDTNGALQGGA